MGVQCLLHVRVVQGHWSMLLWLKSCSMPFAANATLWMNQFAIIRHPCFAGRSAEASASAATMPVARAAAEALIKAEAAGRAITHACLIKSCQLTKEVVIAP